MSLARPGRWHLFTAIAIATLWWQTTGVCADDHAKLESFLDRLGLTELQILHLEKQLQDLQPGPERVQLAKRLADLYAARLLTIQDDEQKSAEVQRRIEELVSQIPEAKTASLEVMRLQARYTRAESLIGQWRADPKRTEQRAQAEAILREISPQLARRAQEWGAEVATLTEQVERLEEGPEQEAQFKKLAQLQAVAGRAGYFAGWSNYYLAVIAADSAALQVARGAFRTLLDIEKDQKYEEIDVNWLGLESVHRSRAVIGLGLVETAAGNLEASRACFKLLEASSVPLEIRDQAAFWFLQGLLNAGRFDEAEEFARSQVDAFSNEASQGKVSLCADLVRAGFAGTEVTEQARRLGKLGIVGLAKMRQFTAIQKLIEQYQIQLDDNAGFHLKWLTGQRLFGEAEKTRQPEDYQAAAKQLSAALADPEAETDAASAGHARYLLAWCRYRLEDFNQAGRDFERAVTGLKASQPDLAAQANWMAYVAYQKMPGTANAAIAMLEQLKRDFPDSQYARRADYHIARLKNTAESPDEAIRRLNKIAPGDPTYLSARYDLCLLLHRRWREAGERDKASAAGKLRDTVDSYLDAARDDAESSRKLKCLLLVAESALAGTSPNLDLAAEYLEKARPLAESLPAGVSAVPEYHYRRLELARAASDDAARQQHGNWLLENAAGSSYEVPALITAARAIDSAARQAEGAQLDKINREGYEIYGRLARHFGSSPVAFSANKNARVVSSRLAHYAYEVGEYAEAAEYLERLLTAFPKEAGYLRRAMLAQFQVGSYSRALEHARTMLLGLPSGSEGWYEAKYYQLRCLLETDKPAVPAVWKQFKLLHPGMGGQPWREKFEQLEREIEKVR